ncbi:hypothetical protein, partial [Hydrogenophilus sp. SS56]|uniref:hypothetical protein n=1 Tax=Hydrogenophilus thiooxidans TaxID=2820326 RepID=UPI001C21ECF2
MAPLVETFYRSPLSSENTCSGGVEMSLADLALRTMLRLTAEQIIGMTYRGILSREPDPDGLAAYAKLLRRAGDLTPLLSELARSEERWRQSFAERAPELVRALYRGLLGREPEPEALQDYAERLTQTHDL